MDSKPCLVIQLQRLGDLVLSFPLFTWLLAQEPDRPVWVVAEPAFFEALMPLAPPVVFFPPEAEPRLRTASFSQVINLSHRPEAARLAGSLRAEQYFGPREINGVTHIEGPWQLYRASLVHNNRHNLFHWADLNALDPLGQDYAPLALRTRWPLMHAPQGTGRVGLFVGASEAAKRPEPAFWAELAKELARRGSKPVFLGGEAEIPLGAEAARLAGDAATNLCGRFTLAELARFLAELDFTLMPDTGPMHISAWVGTPTVNLSMGPVNPWETGPFPPAHLIIRSTLSCRNCWSCLHPTHLCKKCFLPSRIAKLCYHVLQHHSLHDCSLPGLLLLLSAHTGQGLYHLRPTTPLPPGPSSRYALADFWRQWFLERLGGPAPRASEAATRLAALHPHGWEVMRSRLPRWQARIAAAIRKGSLEADFWQRTPPVFRPLSGYFQLYLENEDFGRNAWLRCLADLERLDELLRG